MKRITIVASDYIAKNIQEGGSRIYIESDNACGGVLRLATVIAEITNEVPKLTEREKLLSKVYGLGTPNEFKEVMAALINKVFTEDK